MAIFFGSDYHFGHQNILAYTDRPFKDLDEMTEVLVDNHNSVVRPEDDFYILGDASMGDRTKGLAYFDRMNGTKILIMGNHDHIHPMYSDAKRDKWWATYAQHFDGLVSDHRMQIGGIDFLLNHFPYSGDHTEDRYNAEKIDAWRPKNEGLWLLHGHVHAPEVLWGDNPNERQIHVGIDADYTAYGVERYHPVSAATIMEVIASL